MDSDTNFAFSRSDLFMSTPFPKYTKVKNNYCICYFGNCNEYLIQLKYLRSIIEKELPGIKIYIGFKDGLYNLLDGESNIVPDTVIRTNKKKYAYIRELKCNMVDHPVWDLLQESNIPISIPDVHLPNKTVKCIVAAKGVFPTKSLNDAQISKIKSIYQAKGYVVEVNGDINGTGCVVGVESVLLFKAALLCIETSVNKGPNKNGRILSGHCFINVL